jgi:thermitase
MLVKFSLILALAVLPVLFIAPKSSFTKRAVLPIFVLAVIAHLGLSFLDPNPMNLKFLGLFKSFAALGVVSLVFTFIKSNKIVQIALYIALLAGLKFYADDNTIASKSSALNFEIDDEFELLVRVKEGKTLADLKEQMIEFDLTIEKAFYPAHKDITRLDDYYIVGIPDKNENKINAIFTSLENDYDSEWVEYNEVVSLSPLVETKPLKLKPIKTGLNDPLLSEQWGLTKTNVGEYYNWIRDSKIIPLEKARIAILDTGVDANHEDVRTNYVSTRKVHDNDPKGHGTLCAGVAAAASNNSIGIASLVPNNDFVEVTSIKVLNSFGMGTQHKIIKGILEAADTNCDIISMSLGGPSSDSRQKAYNDAVAYANNKGAIVIVAAGNSNKNAASFTPANVKGVITVSALDENLNRASFSNTVEDIEMAVAAPGVNIHSTYPGNKYGSFSGTSFAAPYVAGLVAVMKSIKPNLNTTEAYEILNSSGIIVSSGNKTGNIVSPKDALNHLVGGMN